MMTAAADHVAALARVYGPDAHELSRQLPDLADGLHAQILAFSTAPSGHAAELLAANLEGARRHVLRTAEAFAREVAE